MKIIIANGNWLSYIKQIVLTELNRLALPSGSAALEFVATHWFSAISRTSHEEVVKADLMARQVGNTAK